MYKQIALLAFTSLLLSACGSPRSALDAVIEAQHFIPYEMPMASTRVGTLMHGNNNELYLVAPPETCFPDQSLRWVQATDLPSQYQHVEFGFDAGVSPILGAGNPVMNLNLSASYVKTVQISFKNPSVEFLNETAFRNYYKNGMSAQCQQLVAEYPFVGQGLRIESMSFSFQDSTGVNIDLSSVIGQIVNFAPGVKWQLDNNYTLTITTPKYIGYRMAQLDTMTGDLNLYYASSIDNDGNWIFDSGSQAPSIDPSRMMTQSLRMAEPLQ